MAEKTKEEQPPAVEKSHYGTLTDVPGAKVDREKLNQSMVP